MSLYTLDNEAAPIDLARVPAPFGAVIGATAAAAFEDLPLLSAIPRAIELDTASKRYRDAYRNYDPAAAKSYMAARGLDKEFHFEDRPYNELELRILADRKTAEIRRQEVMARAEGGLAQGSVRLATALGVSLLDPLNILSAYVPVVGEARYARLVAGAEGALGRAAVRLGVGAVEGAAGAALVEPIIYGANVQQQADYGLADSLLNIGFGTIFGGGLHVVGGAVGDVVARQKVRDFERAVEALTTRPDAPVRAEPGLPDRPLARPDGGVPDPYYDRAVALSREMKRDPYIDLNDPTRVSAALGSKVKSLGQFIKDTGGIADQGGELAARDVSSKTAPGLVRKSATGPASVDAVRERVFDAGYFPDKADYNEISDSELFDALAEDLTVARRYPMDVQEKLGPIRDRQENIDALRANGIEPDMTPADIASRLREIDQEFRAPEAKGPDQAALAEYDTAAARADALSTETRAAMLKASIAQTATDQPVRVEALADIGPRARAVVPIDRAPLLNTRGTGARFHGSPTRLGTLTNNSYSTMNIYGQGFYTTDAVDVARGYTKKGLAAAHRRGDASPTVYVVSERDGVRLFDMEKPVPDSIRASVQGEGSLAELAAGVLDDNPKISLREFYDEIRAQSGEARVSADSVQELFDSFRYTLEKDGYRGLRHEGGKVFNREAHDVRIYWEPADDVAIKPADLNQFRDEYNQFGDRAAAVEQIRTDAREAAKPDNSPLADPEAVRQAEQSLTAYRGDELTGLQKDLDEAETALREAQASLPDPETLHPELRAELAAADDFASQADDMSEAARMLVQCALRHAA